MRTFTYCFLLLFSFNCKVLAQADIEAKTAAEINMSTSSFVSSTLKPTSNISCETHNNDCKGCVERASCYYCDTTNECHQHWERVITDGECDISHAYFLTCNAHFKYLIIFVGVLSATLLVIITVVCCYCCCKKKGIKLSKDDIKWARQREERKEIAAERRKERAERTEEIRKKYGLVKDSNPYQRFDA